MFKPHFVYLKFRYLTLCSLMGLLIFFSGCSKKPEKPKFMDTLILKNGGKIECTIVSETPQKIIVEFQDGRIDFKPDEIQTILRHQQAGLKTKDGIEVLSDRTGNLQNYPYMRTMDGKSHYEKKLRKEGKNFIFETAEGKVAETIPQEKVEKIFLWPPADRKTLSRRFRKLTDKPSDKVHEIDPYVIYSDVESSDFVLYRTVMEGTYHRFMTYFFDLVDTTHPPEWGLGVLLYAKYNDYLHEGGPPKTAGYYRPDDHVLRLYNVREMDMVKDALGEEEKFGGDLSKRLSQIQSEKGGAESGKWKEYEFLEQLQGAVEKDRMRIEQAARTETMETIRHEGTHQVMHLFGIDKDFRGVWFSEGMADYLSPDEPNGIVHTRIMALKSELEEGHQLIPLDFMMSQPSGGHIYNFKDFHLTIQFYCQSWAFIHMLMNHYPSQFMAYMQDLKKQDKSFNADKDKVLFQKHIGKTLKDLDRELDAYFKELATHMDEEEYLFFKNATLRGVMQRKQFMDSVEHLKESGAGISRIEGTDLGPSRSETSDFPSDPTGSSSSSATSDSGPSDSGSEPLS